MRKWQLRLKKNNFWIQFSVVEKKLDSIKTKFIFDKDWKKKVLIRHAESSDLAALEWEGEYARLRNVYAEVFKRMQNGLAIMWVADLPIWGIIGQVFVQLVSKEAELADGKNRAYVHSFRVRSAFQKAGVGSMLMSKVEQDLIKRGYSEISLNVGKDNPDARRIYDHLGYLVVKKDPGKWWYYDHNNKLQHVNEPSWRMLKVFRK